MTISSSLDLIVVGGGQSAKAILMAIAQAKALGHIDVFTICIYSDNPRFGCGFPWDPNQIHKSHLSSLAEACLRGEFGESEHARFLNLVDYLKEGNVFVEVVHDEVLDLVRIGDKFKVITKNGGKRFSKYAVLATGYSAFKREKLSSDGLCPWPFSDLVDRISSDIVHHRASTPFSILIKGNYLTAIDTIVGLAASLGEFHYVNSKICYRSNSETSFKLFWRLKHSFIPKVWGKNPESYEGDYLNWNVVESLIKGVKQNEHIPLIKIAQLIMQEVKGEVLNSKADDFTALEQFKAYLLNLFGRDPVVALKKDIAEVLGSEGKHGLYNQASAISYQKVLFGILPMLSELSPYFSEPDRRYFDNELRTLFYCAAMPMALENACKLDSLFESGLLEIHHKQVIEEECSSVISATGFDFDVTKSNSTLTKNLVMNNLMRPKLIEVDKFKGVQIDPKSCLVLNSETHSHLYAIGPLVSADFIDAQSIGHIQRDAQRIVNHILRMEKNREQYNKHEISNVKRTAVKLCKM